MGDGVKEACSMLMDAEEEVEIKEDYIDPNNPNLNSPQKKHSLENFYRDTDSPSILKPSGERQYPGMSVKS